MSLNPASIATIDELLLSLLAPPDVMFILNALDIKVSPRRVYQEWDYLQRAYGLERVSPVRSWTGGSRPKGSLDTKPRQGSRKQEVLRLHGLKMPPAEIAATLKITTRAVNHHIANQRRK